MEYRILIKNCYVIGLIFGFQIMEECPSCGKMYKLKTCFYCDHECDYCSSCIFRLESQQFGSRKLIISMGLTEAVNKCDFCCTYVCSGRACQQKHKKLDCGNCARKSSTLPNTDVKFNCKTCNTIICGGCRFKCNNSNDVYCIDCKCPHLCTDNCNTLQSSCSRMFLCEMCNSESYHSDYSLFKQCCSGGAKNAFHTVTLCCKCKPLFPSSDFYYNNPYSCTNCKGTFCETHKFLVIHKNGKATNICKKCR